MAKFGKLFKEMSKDTTVKICAMLVLMAFCIVGGWAKKAFLTKCVVAIRAWLNNKHAFTLPGWGVVCWLLLPALSITAFIFLWQHFFRCKKKYCGKVAVISILAEWLRKNEQELVEEKVVRFRELDEQLNLKSGSARKYLKGILSHHEFLCASFVDKQTILIKRR